MFTSTQVARKEMLALVDSVWSAGAAAITGGSTPEVRYEGNEKAELPGAENYWMRASTTNVTTRQSGHRLPDEPNGSAVVYDTFGFITLQVFAPMTAPDSWSKGELLSELGQCMFMASETGGAVWFRNPRVIKQGNDGTWYRWNVIADYQFSHTKG